MNNVSIVGNLVKDLDLRHITNDKEVLDNTIAVRRDFKNKNGEYESDFIDITIFGKQAKFLNDYGYKGSKVGIIGQLKQERWEQQDGTKRSKIKIIVSKIELLDTKKEEKQETKKYETKPANDPFFQNNTKVDISDDMLPF
jgi:single-strand DNA-binding protein